MRGGYSPHPEAAAPAQRAERGLGVRLRRAVGLRHTFGIDGVKYRELSTESLRQALSRSGSGRKEYEVTFPSGESMRIAATAQRVFADLVGPRLLGVYGRIEEALRPGMRVLILESGTGFEAAWVAARVAPSGAVVALDRDAEAVAYAQQRYASSIISFEQGGVEAIAGETRGAFDAVCAVAALRQEDDHLAVLRELWRLLGPAGWLMVACPLAGPTRRGDSEGKEPAVLAMESDALVQLLTRAVREAPAEPPRRDAEGSNVATPAAAARNDSPAMVSALGLEQDAGWAVAVAVRPDEAL